MMNNHFKLITPVVKNKKLFNLNDTDMELNIKQNCSTCYCISENCLILGEYNKCYYENRNAVLTVFDLNKGEIKCINF